MRYALPSSTAHIRHSSGQLSGTRCATALVRMLLTVFVASFGSFAVSAGAVEATSGASRPPVIRLGMMAFTSEGEYSTHVEAEDRMLSGMAAILNARVPQFRFETKFYRMDALQEAVRSEAVDLFLASSGFFWEMQLKYGARDLATVVSERAPDPNRAEGTLFVTLKNRADIEAFKDLRGKRVTATGSNAFSGHHVGLGEIARRGEDPDPPCG